VRPPARELGGVAARVLQVVLYGNDANIPAFQRSKRRLERERAQVGAGTSPNARSSDPEGGGVSVVS